MTDLERDIAAVDELLEHAEACFADAAEAVRQSQAAGMSRAAALSAADAAVYTRQLRLLGGLRARLLAEPATPRRTLLGGRIAA